MTKDRKVKQAEIENALQWFNCSLRTTQQWRDRLLELVADEAPATKSFYEGAIRTTIGVVTGVASTSKRYGIFMKDAPETNSRSAYETFPTREKAEARLPYWDGMSGPEGVEIREFEKRTKGVR